MKCRTQLTVRTYECDSYNHVNNAVYLHYLEHGRMDFLTQIGFDYRGLVARGLFLYVSRVDIRYRSPAFFGDELVVESEPVTLKAASGTIRQRVVKADGTLCAEADVTWACVGADGRLSRIPPELMVDGLRPAARPTPDSSA